jgi:hypothetical protein
MLSLNQGFGRKEQTQNKCVSGAAFGRLGEKSEDKSERTILGLKS